MTEPHKASILSILIAYLYVRYLMSEQNVNGPAGMLVHNTLFHKFQVIEIFHQFYSHEESPPFIN